MGEDCGTWVRQRRLDCQSPNLSSFRAPCEGKQTGFSPQMNPGIDNMATFNEAMPAYASSVLPHLQLRYSNEPPQGWFYCLPRFRQAFMPASNASNFSVKRNLPAEQVKGFREETVLNREAQKQFLVIDQTCDQTTFIYSPRLDPWHSKEHGPNNLNVNEPAFQRDVNDLIGSSFPAIVDENQERDMESEMHEDTEEINALLYSDGDDYSTEDEDEVTSTGHSPSTMTAHDDSQQIFRAATEEVGESTGKSKKRKLSDCGAYDDTATSLNMRRPSKYEGGGDAESRCSCGKNQGSGEMGSSSGNKKMRKEKIRKVLSVLQTIIPCGKDKDPMVLLDEAIRCLKSLKQKAKALGLDALLSS